VAFGIGHNGEILAGGRGCLACPSAAELPRRFRGLLPPASTRCRPQISIRPEAPNALPVFDKPRPHAFRARMAGEIVVRDVGMLIPSFGRAEKNGGCRKPPNTRRTSPLASGGSRQPNALSTADGLDRPSTDNRTRSTFRRSVPPHVRAQRNGEILPAGPLELAT